jgi:restriction endonuclease S subunit
MNRAVEISVGSLSPTINWTTLKLEEFALPPLDQQRRIAEILWAVDECTISLLKVAANLEILVVLENNNGSLTQLLAEGLPLFRSLPESLFA